MEIYQCTNYFLEQSILLQKSIRDWVLACSRTFGSIPNRHDSYSLSLQSLTLFLLFCKFALFRGSKLFLCSKK